MTRVEAKMSKIEEVIGHFDTGRVLAIGDLMIDQYIYGTVNRLSPEAPVPVVDIERELCELGGAANAVNNIKILGGNVDVIGVIGTDDAGRILLDLFKERHINVDGIILCEERPTTVKTRVIGNGCHIVRIDKETKKAIDGQTTNRILKLIEDDIDNYNAILISDYNKGLITKNLLRKLIPLANSHEIPIIVNSKVENLVYYKNVTMVISDMHEASQVIGIKPINETSIRNMGQWLMTRLDCDGVLIVRGGKGLTMFEKDGDVKHLSTHIGEIHDIAGVGDAITGVMALALSCGSDIQTATIIANSAMTVALGKTGTGLMSKEDFLKQIR